MFRQSQHTGVCHQPAGEPGGRPRFDCETPDAVLVADRTRSQDVKHIVNTLSQLGREEHTLHRKMHRPWGWYDSIDEGGGFKVKRIQVKPGASLSLQKHHHRAEHWVMVMGTAEITNGDKKLLLSENQPTYIPLGEVHRLANPGSIPLEIIEVQSGSYWARTILSGLRMITEEVFAENYTKFGED